MFQAVKMGFLALTATIFAASSSPAANRDWTNALGNQKFGAAGNWSGSVLADGDNLTIGKNTDGAYPIIASTPTLPNYIGSLTIGFNNGGTLSPGHLTQTANTLEARSDVLIGVTHTGTMLMTGSAIFKHTTAGNFYVSKGTIELGTTGSTSDNPTLTNSAGIFFLGYTNITDPSTLNAYSGSVNCTTDVNIGCNTGSNGLLNLRERAAFHHDTGTGNFTVGNIGTGIITLGTDGATATTPSLTNLRGKFSVGCSNGSGTVTAYAGSIATGGEDEIGVSDAKLAQLNLYGNSTFTHQSTTANFTLGYNVAATLLIGRDGIATDNATLNLAGGTFRIGYASKTSTVSAYSGAINAHGGVLAGAYGGTANINLYGSAKFLHDTTGDFSFYNGTLTLGRSGNTTDNAALTLNAGALYLANGNGASGNVIVNSGAVTGNGMTCLGMGYGTATSEWKQEGGTTNLGNCPVYLGGHSTAGGYSTNTLRLDGGVFAAAKFSSDSACTADELSNIVDKIYFNGGTLRATANCTTGGGFLAFGSLSHFTAYVQSRGAVIDTNSHDVLIASALSADPGSTGGGLMKLGEGKLTLSGTLAYTGNTTINAGTLVAERGINTPSSTVYVATGGKLTAPSIVAGTLTIGGSPKPLPTASAVPEPGTLLLALTAMTVVAGGILRFRKT